MAEAAVTINVGADGVWTITWAAMADGDTGKPVKLPNARAATVQCTAGTIGTSTLQGSNDGTVWGALGAGLSIAAANRVDPLASLPAYVRPSVGAGGTGAVVVLTVHTGAR